MFEDLMNMGMSQKDIFKADINTLLGKNMVKNFVAQMAFEIRTIGYSESANDIAAFYDSCKLAGGICSFFSHPVVKMILNELENQKSVKIYLKERIFDEITQDQVSELDNIYDNNESISNDISNKNQEYMKDKEIRRRKIKKIMKEQNCTEEQAESILNAEEYKKLADKMDNKLKDFLSTGIVEGAVKTSVTWANISNSDIIAKQQDLKDYIDKTSDSEEVELNSDSEKSEDNNDEGFWL